MAGNSGQPLGAGNSPRLQPRRKQEPWSYTAMNRILPTPRQSLEEGLRPQERWRPGDTLMVAA